METIDNMFSRSLATFMVYIFYQQVLNRDLLRAMQKKRAPLLPTMLFHHDNAPSHRASTTQETINKRSIEVFCHPQYSPDLAPCDFFLFPTLKKILRGQQFEDVADLQRAVKSAIVFLGPSAYKNCFDSWVKRCRKCISFNGEYFEKNECLYSEITKMYVKKQPIITLG